MSKSIAYLIFLVSVCSEIYAQSVGVNTSNIDPSAVFEVVSDGTKGFLGPKVTSAQRDAIVNPAIGLLVYVTDDKRFYFYNGDGWAVLRDIGDNLGNHTLADNLRTNSFFISGDGDNEGLFVDENGLIGVGLNNPTERLTVQSESNASTPILVKNVAGNNIVRINENGVGDGSFDLLKNDGAVGIHLTSKSNSNSYINAGNVGVGTNDPTQKLDIDGQIRIRGGSPGLGKVLVSDADGVASWETLTSSADNLGNHSATQNLSMNGHWINGDGGSEGIRVSNQGHVEIRRNTSGYSLTINDLTTPTGAPSQQMQMNTSASNVHHRIAGGSHELYQIGSSGGNISSMIFGPEALSKYPFVVNTGGIAGLNMPSGNFSGTTRFKINNDKTGVDSSFIFTKAGHLGIGTSSPAAKLHIVGSGLDGSRVQLQNTDGGSQWYISSRTTGLNFAELGAADGRLYLENGGNVGIGTVNPKVKLDVNGVIRAGDVTSTSGSLIIGGTYGNGYIATFGTQFSSGAPFIGYGVQAKDDGPGYKSSTGVNAKRAAIQIGPDINFLNASQQIVAIGDDLAMNSQMVIKESGKVGIGVPNPVQAKLEIRGEGGSAPEIKLHHGGSNLHSTIQGPVNRNVRFDLDGNDAIDMFEFRNIGSFGAVPIMALRANGNVGVGTNAPTRKLDIDGEIRIRGGAPGAGKVLTSDANGVASWVDPASTDDGDWILNGNDMYNANSGGVGIGTFTPNSSFKLNVQKNVGNSTDRASTYVLIEAGNDGLADAEAGIYLKPKGNWGSSLEYGIAGGSGNNSLNFYNHTDGETEMVLDGDGNLGVGTTSPNFKVDVTDDIRAASVMIGRGKGSATTSNTRVGRESLELNTTGINNSVFGYFALTANTTGAQNTAVGTEALRNNTTGNNNTAVGRWSLLNNTTGGNNLAVGPSALQVNTTGSSNIAIGTSTLNSNTTGTQNIGIGGLTSNTTGTRNVGMGVGVLSNMDGSYNSAVGSLAGADITNASYNTLMGYNTGRGIETGGGNTIIGSHLTGFSPGLSNSVAIGSYNAVRLFINSSGNTGIGTTTPSEKVEIQATNSGLKLDQYGLSEHGIMVAYNKGTPSARVGAAVGDRFNVLGAYISGANASQYVNPAFGIEIEHETVTSSFGDVNAHFKLNTTASGIPYTAMTLARGGKLGVGTESPKEKISTTGGLITNQNTGTEVILNGGAPVYGMAIDMDKNLSSGFMRNIKFSYDDGVNTLASIGVHGNLNGGAAPNLSKMFFDAGGNSFTNADMVLSTEGNLGIGVQSPAEKIHVSGNVAASKYRLQYNGGSIYDALYYDGATMVVGNQVNSSLALRTAGSSVNRLVISNLGRVGIGTSAPDTEFEVVGKTKTTDLQVSNGAAEGKVLTSDANGNATWQDASTGGTSITLVTSNITLDETHSTIIITSGSPTITLPAASSALNKVYRIIKHSAGFSSITAYKNLSGGSDVVVDPYLVTLLQSDGNNWYRINNK